MDMEKAGFVKTCPFSVQVSVTLYVATKTSLASGALLFLQPVNMTAINRNKIRFVIFFIPVTFKNIEIQHLRNPIMIRTL
jgi:hypothetical protein